LELVMVTTIISILLSLGIPSFHRALEQSRAQVASANLQAIWSAERLYWLEYRTYAPDLATLQSLDLLDASIGSQTFYLYDINAADTTTFSASAMRVSNASWNGAFSIDQSGVVSGTLGATGQTDIIPGF
jgi:Tfp pilus assembly protein PilE